MFQIHSTDLATNITTTAVDGKIGCVVLKLWYFMIAEKQTRHYACGALSYEISKNTLFALSFSFDTVSLSNLRAKITPQKREGQV